MKQPLPRHLPLVAAAAVVLSLTAAPAFAFTFEDAGAPSGGTSLRYNGQNGLPASQYKPTDPPYSSGGTGSSYQQGNTTLQFGASQRPFNQRYDANRYFDMNYTLGR